MFREFARIQNSMFGLIVLSQNIYTGELAIQYYKAINPKKPSEIQKGDKIYDYKNGGFFKLDIFDSKELLLYLTNVTRISNFDAPMYEITHFPKDAVHKLIIKPIKDKKAIEFSIVLLKNKKVEKSIKLILNRISIEVLIDFLTTYKDVITMKNMLQEIRFKPNNNNNEKQQNDIGNNQSTNNGNVQQDPQAKPDLIDEYPDLNDIF